MQISMILANKGDTVATIPAEATVADAVAELNRQKVGALVVSPDGRTIAGIVSERDVVRHLDGLQGSLMTKQVAAIMSAEVKTCSPDDTIESLAKLMTDSRIRHVPVVRDGELCGIVSIGDVVKSRIGELEKDRNELVEYITAR